AAARGTLGSMFVIEDRIHAEWIGEYATRAEALSELRRLAELAWDHAPNSAPCMSSATCGREYELIHFDQTSSPWTERERLAALNISAAKTEWLLDDEVSPT